MLGRWEAKTVTVHQPAFQDAFESYMPGPQLHAQGKAYPGPKSNLPDLASVSPTAT